MKNGFFVSAAKSRFTRNAVDEFLSQLEWPETLNREMEATTSSLLTQSFTRALGFKTARGSAKAFYRQEAEGRNKPAHPLLSYLINQSLGIGRQSYGTPTALLGDARAARIEEYRNRISAWRTLPDASSVANRISDSESQARYYAMQERFQRVMAGDYRQSLSTGDDDQFAFGADTGVHDDFAYLRQIESAQARRRRERARGRHNAWYDNLSEKRQVLFDLTMRYGGGEEGRAAARHHIDRSRERERRINNLELYRKHPWVKPLMTAGIIQTRDLPRIAKAVGRLEKAPIFGKFIKHPAFYAAQGVMTLAKKYLEYSGNTVKLGAESDVLGIPLSSLKSAGHVLSTWGGNEGSYAKALSPYGGKLGKMMMGLGGTDFLLDDAIALGGDILGGGAGGLMSMTERVGRYAERIREAYLSGNIEKGITLGQMAGFDTSMMEAAIRGEDLSKYTSFYRFKDKMTTRRIGEKWNRLLDDPIEFFLGPSSSRAEFGEPEFGRGIENMIGKAYDFVKSIAVGDAKFDADKQYGEQPSATRDAKGTVIYLNKADFHGVQDVEGLKSALENEAGSNADYARAAESNVPKRW